LSWLRQYGEGKLTGTGSCVFLGCDTSLEQAQALLNVFRLMVLLQKAQNVSPTHQAVKAAIKESDY
jgi:4-diphosphocytidyl-2-C-methyl-D-erythritol kinase